VGWDFRALGAGAAGDGIRRELPAVCPMAFKRENANNAAPYYRLWHPETRKSTGTSPFEMFGCFDVDLFSDRALGPAKTASWLPKSVKAA